MSLPERIEDVNGIGPIGNQVVINTLEVALAEAKAGRLMCVAMVKVIAPGQFMPLIAGGAWTEVYTGAGALQKLSLDALFGRQSPILRAGR